MFLLILTGCRFRLWGLREVFFDNNEKRAYSNKETVSLFTRHFKLQNAFHVCYTKKLNALELDNLIQMTPLTWSMDKARFDAFKYRNFNRDYSRFGHFSRELVSGNYS